MKSSRWSSKRLLLTIRKLIVPVIILSVWHAVTSGGYVRPIILPGFVDIWESAIDLAPLLPKSLVTTISMTLSGFVMGISIGTAAGLLMVASDVIRDMLGDLFDFLRPVPVFALIPLFILWFGLGRAPQIALITLGTSVIVGVSTVEAIRNVPSIYVRAALTLGADRSTIYRTVVVPYIMPHLIGAIRVAAAASWGLDVAAEFMGSQSGLGYLIIMQGVYLMTSGIVFLVLCYSTLAILFDKLLGVIETRITGWTERTVATGAAGAIVGKG